MDQFEGIGGSYVINKNGLREKVEGTADKLDSAIEVAAVAEEVSAPAFLSSSEDKGE